MCGCDRRVCFVCFFDFIGQNERKVEEEEKSAISISTGIPSNATWKFEQLRGRKAEMKERD
jgi:hypothetical protein